MDHPTTYTTVLDALRVSTLTYATIAVLIALALTVSMVVQIRRHPDEWEQAEESLAANGTDPGTAIALIALAWPVLAVHLIRGYVQTVR